MRKPYAILLMVTLFLLTFSNAYGLEEKKLSPQTLAYDSGNASYGLWLGRAGDMFAVRFTPPYSPCQILKVKYFIMAPTASFKVRVFHITEYVEYPKRDPFVLTVDPKSGSGVGGVATRGWTTVDLSEHKIFTENEFYIAMQTVTPEEPQIGYSEYNPQPRSYWVWMPTYIFESDLDAIHNSWHKGWGPGNFMIRAEVGPAFDSDGDGLYDYEEDRINTDLEKSDTDGDGLEDGDEIKVYNSNPLSIDTDDDGLEDNYEVLNNLKPDQWDSDDDGLSDGEEINDYGTDPILPDSDGDGLSDGYESLNSSTNPLVVDTDKDGIIDGLEINMGTNPLKSDSDDDGLEDLEEGEMGTNPLLFDSDGDGWKDSIDFHPMSFIIPNIPIGIAIPITIMASIMVMRRTRARVSVKFRPPPVKRKAETYEMYLERLEELRAKKRISESTYLRLKEEYEEKLRKK